jgi:hypothetical protein
MPISGAETIEVIIYGFAMGLATVLGFEASALVLALVAKSIFQFTGWVHLGSERSAWLGAVVLYWGLLPAVFLGLIVCARTCKSRWNGKPNQ